MSLLSLDKSPRLKATGDQPLLQWTKAVADFLDNRSGQLILPYGRLNLVNGANQDVKLPAATFVEVVGPTLAYSIGGLAGGMLGRFLVLFNAAVGAMTLNFDDAGSQAANQINTLTGANVTCTAAILIHRPPGSRWVVLASR